MAEQIKYVSLDNLTKYDTKIKEHIQTKDDALKTNLEGQVTVVANALDAEITRSKAAESTNAAAAQAAQTDVDNLEAYVGTFTASEGVDTVVKYIDKKTTGIASDEALTAIGERVTQAEKDIDAVEGRATTLEAAVADRYTKGEVDAKVDALTQANTATQGEVDALETVVANNKTAIEGTVTKLEEKVDANESDIEGKMTALTSRVEANETAVKTTLPNAITAEKERAEGIEAGLEGRIETMEAFWEAAQADGTDSNVIDTLKEIQDYIAGDETGASEMLASIKQNSDDIDALEGKMTAAEGKISTLEGEMDTAQSDIATLQAAIADGGSVDVRIDALEAAVGESGSVAEDISSAKDEAIATASQDATTKANTAESNAKAYTDTEVGKDRTRLDALEADTHTHSNKALLDTYTQTEANLADAVAKKHEHSNLSVLEGITADKVTAWDTVTSKAAQADLTAEVNRATAKEDELQAAIDAFTECTTEEINALFA